MFKPGSAPRPRPAHLALALIVLVALASMGLVATKPTKPLFPITLKFVGATGDAVNREAASGWPITLRLTSNGELGIATPNTPPIFPKIGDVGYIVFSDPNGCFSLGLPNSCPTVDETYLEFTPDLDRPGLANPHGNADRLIALTETGGGGSPRVLTFNFETHLNDLLQPYGPEVGGASDTLEFRCSSVNLYAGQACAFDTDCSVGQKCRQLPIEPDGYGYGADDDLPGLVLLSDTGVGVVLDQNFNPPRVRQARNLAGLLNSVAYELKDGSHHTSVTAHLNVPHGLTYHIRDSASNPFPTQQPRGLFTPVVLADRCIGDPNACGGTEPHIFRIDGGPQVSMTDNDLLAFMESKVVTIRAFVVNGTAPSVLSDLNGDGFVGAKDAVLAGYQLVAGEEVMQLRAFYDDNLDVFPLLFDFDGNGDAMGHFVAPGGAGHITPVPE